MAEAIPNQRPMLHGDNTLAMCSNHRHDDVHAFHLIITCSPGVLFHTTSSRPECTCVVPAMPCCPAAHHENLQN